MLMNKNNLIWQGACGVNGYRKKDALIKNKNNRPCFCEIKTKGKKKINEEQ